MSSNICFEKNSAFLVTGGAGFIGSNITEALLNMGYKVRVLDNFSTGKRKNVAPFGKNPNFELMEGDIRDKECCEKALCGIDYVLHQAAWGSVPRSLEQPLEYNENNITGTLNMMYFAAKAGVKAFVYASSAAVYGDDERVEKTEEHIGRPLSPYAFTKLADEHYGALYSELYGLKTVGLRYFNVFGKNQDPEGDYASVIPKFIRQILRGEDVTIDGDGGQTRDFVHIENVVQANLRAAMKAENASGRVFNVACGEKITLLEFYDKLTELLESHRRPVFGPPRAGDIRHSLASIENIKKYLEYMPTVGFFEGLEKTIEWYKENI